jgi:hypothetical protein
MQRTSMASGPAKRVTSYNDYRPPLELSERWCHFLGPLYFSLTLSLATEREINKGPVASCVWMATPVVSSPSGFGDNSSPPTKSSSPTRTTDPAMMHTLSSTTTAEMADSSASSSAFVNDYSQFQETFGTYESSTTLKEENHSDDSQSSSTFWDLLLSLYFPIVVMWLRRSLLEVTNLIRSLVVGHLLRSTLCSVSEWMTDKTPSWLHRVLLQTHTTATSSKNLDPHAWPPPALTALALLTVFTLLVHPDGYTWIMLGKLRCVN